MADPITWITVGSTLLSANASYQQGRMIEEQSEIEAKQIEDNARRRTRQSLLDAEEERRKKRIALSNARAAQASSGGTTTSGQSLDQLGKVAGIYEFNANEILYGGQTDAAALYGQAAAARTEGKSAKFNGTVGAISTILQGGSSVYQSLPRSLPDPSGSGSLTLKRNKTTGHWRAPSMAAPR